MKRSYDLTINPATSAYVCCLCLHSDSDFTVTLRLFWEVGTFHAKCCTTLHLLKLSKFQIDSRSRKNSAERFRTDHLHRFHELVHSPPILEQFTYAPMTQPSSVRHLLEVFKYLSLPELCSIVSRVCLLWRALSDNEELWKQPRYLLQPIPLPYQTPPKRAVLYQILKTCFVCQTYLEENQVEMICPKTGKPMCQECFYDPERGLLPLRKVSAHFLMSKNTLKQAGVRVVVKYKEPLIYTFTVEKRVFQFRETRKKEAMDALMKVGCPGGLLAEVTKLPLMPTSLGTTSGGLLKRVFDYILARNKRVLPRRFLEETVEELRGELNRLGR